MTPRLIAPLRLAAALVAAAPRALRGGLCAEAGHCLIMMENHGTDTLLGNKETGTSPNSSPSPACASRRNIMASPIQDLPNYLALIAGDEMGIHDDCKAGADIKCKPEEFYPTRTSTRRPAIS